MRPRIWTVPNQITFLRLGFLPFFLILIFYEKYAWALLVLFISAGTDALDGLLARSLDQKSALGAYLDPIADKLLLMSSYLFLAIPSYPARMKVPVWLAVMVLSRDFLVLLVGLLLILTSGKKRFPPSWAGKVTTVMQIVTVLFVLCANIWPWPREILLIAYGATASVTVISGFDYLHRVARNPEEPVTATS